MKFIFFTLAALSSIAAVSAISFGLDAVTALGFRHALPSVIGLEDKKSLKGWGGLNPGFDRDSDGVFSITIDGKMQKLGVRNNEMVLGPLVSGTSLPFKGNEELGGFDFQLCIKREIDQETGEESDNVYYVETLPEGQPRAAKKHCENMRLECYAYASDPNEGEGDYDA